MTLGNADRVLQDDLDRLTEVGRREAQELGRHLASFLSAKRLVTSPLRRAVETAEIVAPFLALEPEIDARLAERDFDFPLSTTLAEANRLQVEALLNPFEELSDGESVAHHRERVREWCEENLNVPSGMQDTVVVAHGGTIEHIQACLWGAPLEAVRRMYVACDSAHYHLWKRVFPVRDVGVWRLEGVNCRGPGFRG